MDYNHHSIPTPRKWVLLLLILEEFGRIQSLRSPQSQRNTDGGAHRWCLSSWFSSRYPYPPFGDRERERERERNCCWCWWIALGDRLEEEEEERGTPSSELACGCRFLKHLCGDLMGLEEPLVVIRAVFWERALRYVAAAQRVAC